MILVLSVKGARFRFSSFLHSPFLYVDETRLEKKVDR